MLVPALFCALAGTSTGTGTGTGTGTATYPLASGGGIDAVDTMSAKVAVLLTLDDQLLDIGRRLDDIEAAVAHLDDPGANPNPYSWTPHRPTLRDRKRALRRAREQVPATMTETWPPLNARRPPAV